MILHLFSVCTILLLSVLLVRNAADAFNVNERGGPRFLYHEKTNLDKWAFSTVTLSCKTSIADQNSDQTIWFKDKVELDSEFYRKHRGRIVENKKNQTLTIKNIRNEDIGEYMCNVSNRAGYILRQYSLDIINYCDLYAGFEEDIVHLIPIRCICLWLIKYDCAKKGINWMDFDLSECRDHSDRLKLQVSPSDCRKVDSALGPKLFQRYLSLLANDSSSSSAVVGGRRYGMNRSVQHVQYLHDDAPSSKQLTRADANSFRKMCDFLIQSNFTDIYNAVDKLLTREQYDRIVRQLLSVNWTSLDEKERSKQISKVEYAYSKAVEDASKIRDDDNWSTVIGASKWDPHAKLSKDEKTKLASCYGALRFADGKGDYVSEVIPSGYTIKLECKYDGPSGTGIAWRKGDEVLHPKNQRPIGKAYILKPYALEIQNPVPTDSGQYSCEVYCNSTAIKRTFSLIVRDVNRSKPYILPNILMNQTTNMHDSVSFNCQVFNPPIATSTLSTHFMWIHLDNHSALFTNMTDGSFILNMTAVAENEHTYSDNYGDRSVLTISNTTETDEGYYVCIAGNSMGKDVAYAYLHVNNSAHKKSSSSLLALFILISILVVLLLGLFFIWLLRLYFNKKAKNQIGQLEQYMRPERKKVVITKNVPKLNDDDSGALSTYHVQFFPLPSANHRHQGNGGRQPLYSDLTLHMTEYVMESDPEWEIHRSRLKLIKQLGEGAFGEVWKAALTLSNDSELSMPKDKNDNGEILVAVKKLKSNAQDKEMDDLIREMITFQNIGQHDNILRLIGCSTQKGPLFVVLELCRYGNLRDFLRAHRPKDTDPAQATKENDGYLQARKTSEQNSASNKEETMALINPLTLRHLVQFAWQVARGMQYMTSRKIIHRDLAARNVLVADDFVLKISDFGLSRDVHYNDYYRKKGNGRLPIKWMALEALDSHVYTVSSDVWSFGILLWEIITLGGTPYPSIAMQQLYSCLKEGYRMEAPDNCPDEIYNAMIACWQEDPKQRPTFDVLVDYFDWMLNQSASDQEKYLDLKSTTEVDENLSDGELSPMLSENGTSLKKLRTRPLSEPIINSPAPINDYEENSEVDNDSSSLLTGEKVVYCANTPDGKPSYAVIRRPTMRTDKASECKTASVDSAIGSPGWQLDTQAPIMVEKRMRNSLLINTVEDATTPLIFPEETGKNQPAQGNQHYYNCSIIDDRHETADDCVLESSTTLKPCVPDTELSLKSCNADASSLSSSPANDVFISVPASQCNANGELENRGEADAERAALANGRQRRFSDDSSSSGRGSGTSTEGFGIEQYCTIKNTSTSSKLFPFTPSVFQNPFSANCNSLDMKFFT